LRIPAAGASFRQLAEKLAACGAREHHFGISRPDGRLLCASWDDFMVVKLADGLREAVRGTTR
jgi:hypothetical protein